MSADHERTAESPTNSFNGEKGRVTQLEQSEDVYAAEVATSEVDERKLMRKVDLRLIPWLSLLYLLSFLDRTSIGNAKVRLARSCVTTTR